MFNMAFFVFVSRNLMTFGYNTRHKSGHKSAS